MKINDIIDWISSKKTEIFLAMQRKVSDDEKWHEAKGALYILDELTIHINKSEKLKDL